MHVYGFINTDFPLGRQAKFDKYSQFKMGFVLCALPSPREWLAKSVTYFDLIG